MRSERFTLSGWGVQARFDLVKHLLLIGESACLELGPDKLAVDVEFKAAAAARDQLDISDLLLEGVENLRCQTDSFGLVVSNCAIFQREVHGFILS